MSSRAEEKERRRQERLAAEQAAAGRAKRMRLVQFGVGGVLAVAIVVAVAIAVASGGGDGGGGSDAPAKNVDSSARIPAPTEFAQVDQQEEAAERAGCTFRELPSEGRGHQTEPVRYRTNPPTSGAHDPVPAEDGVYEPGNPPKTEALVHTLEHGRVIFQYRKGTPENVVAQLETLWNEPVRGADAYHSVLVENTTNMPFQVAATTWTRMLGCPEVNERTWDALRSFRARWVDKAPELVP